MSRDFYTLPFFDKRHIELKNSLADWCTTNIADHSAQENEDTACLKFAKLLGNAGFLRYAVPSPYGGIDKKLDVRSLCIIRETLASFSGLADFVFAMQGLGGGPISLFGTEEQKRNILPKIASGEYIAAFALSESETGSDVSNIQSEARLKDNAFILNGTKAWISNAGLANVYSTFARTGEAPGAKGLSAFIVTPELNGFEVSERIPITSPHPVGSLKFSNVSIPKNNLLGNSGEGFKIAMSTLDIFRSTVGAAALGFAKRAHKEAINFAKERSLFGNKLSDFQMTQDKLAQMATELDAASLLVYRAAWLKDSGEERVTKEAAMAKYYATETAQGVIDKAVQILGGRGVVRDSVVERLYRDIRPLRIYEGTSEIQKLVIAREELKG